MFVEALMLLRKHTSVHITEPNQIENEISEFCIALHFVTLERFLEIFKLQLSILFSFVLILLCVDNLNCFCYDYISSLNY